jgi:hypothetical protein
MRCYSHLLSLQCTLDGNFKIAMGSMNADVVDVDLLRGRGLQPLTETMERYRETAYKHDMKPQDVSLIYDH